MCTPLRLFSLILAGVIGFQRIMFSNLGTWAFPAWLAWDVWLPYLSGALTLIVGVTVIMRDGLQRRGPDKLIALAPLFLAVPLAVFGTQHFTFAQIVARMVPSWIPGHLFWALFVGACLISAALSLVVRKHAALAATLFGIMLLMFEVLISIPRIVSAPGNRFAWAVV